REHVLAAGARHHRAELGKLHRADERVQSAGEPHAQEESRVRQIARHFARGPQNSRGNAVSDGDGNPEGDAEHLMEPAGWRMCCGIAGAAEERWVLVRQAAQGLEGWFGWKARAS